MITLTLNSNKLIRKNSSKEVINHGIDGIGGLFDPNIFGYTIDEKKSKMGYIDLKGHFIDMGVFKIAKRLFRDLPYIIDGSKKFKIGADGGLILDPDGEASILIHLDFLSIFKRNLSLGSLLTSFNPYSPGFSIYLGNTHIYAEL